MAALLALPVAAALSPASAEYQLCNETSYVVRAAVAYRGADGMQSAGWFTVYPGFCRPIIEKPLTDETYFIHGRTIAGHAGPMHHWAGDTQFCIAAQDFDIVGDSDCEKRGYQTAYFAEVDVGRARSWTTTFTEPAGHTLEDAQILGVQRLMVDLGYMTAKQMDGVLGRNTTRAIEKFKRDYSLDLPGEPTVELLRALVQAAEKRAEGHGLELCNTTPQAIWAAIGLPKDATAIETRGWFELQPEQCVRPVVEPLSKNFVYLYAETVDAAERKLYWHGDNALCTNDVMFTITAAPDSCTDLGYVAASFLKVDTEGREFWTYSFKESDASERPGL